MPLYEYRCQDCRHEFEVLQAVDDGSERLLCPACSAPNLEKLFSSFATGASERFQPSRCEAPGCTSGFT